MLEPIAVVRATPHGRSGTMVHIDKGYSKVVLSSRYS